MWKTPLTKITARKSCHVTRRKLSCRLITSLCLCLFSFLWVFRANSTNPRQTVRFNKLQTLCAYVEYITVDKYWIIKVENLLWIYTCVYFLLDQNTSSDSWLFGEQSIPFEWRKFWDRNVTVQLPEPCSVELRLPTYQFVSRLNELFLVSNRSKVHFEMCVILWFKLQNVLWGTLTRISVRNYSFYGASFAEQLTNFSLEHWPN